MTFLKNKIELELFVWDFRFSKSHQKSLIVDSSTNLHTENLHKKLRDKWKKNDVFKFIYKDPPPKKLYEDPLNKKKSLYTRKK